MPRLKKTNERYDIINECLTNKQKRYCTIQRMIERFVSRGIHVTKRTVERDINIMRNELDSPIEYCHTNKGYYYTDPDFTIKPTSLSRQQLDAIFAATSLLKKFSNIKTLSQFQRGIEKTLKVFDQLKAREEGTEDIIYFEPNPYNKGLENFDTIHQACVSKQPLTIDYTKFGLEPTRHTVHPYFLRDYKEWWYLLCYSEEREKVIVLALDRMMKIDNANISYKVNKTFKPKEYFRHTLGVTLGEGAPQTIELLFSVRQGDYIKAQHLHHTQRIIKDDEQGMVITLKLIPNYELQQLILGFGPEVQVVRPVELRNQVKEKIRKMMNSYGD